MERRDASRSVDIRIEDRCLGEDGDLPETLVRSLAGKADLHSARGKIHVSVQDGCLGLGKYVCCLPMARIIPGLTPRIVSLCEDHGMSVKVHGGNFGESPITRKSIDDFIATLKLPYTPRDYQLDGVYAALLHRRCVLLSPTASGKSLVIYVPGAVSVGFWATILDSRFRASRW